MDTVFRSRTVVTSKTSQITYSLEVKANPWVKLLQRPSSCSSDKALLLYRVSSNEWIAWIPEFGETRLNERQFYYLD
jgi:hypothetical protein